MTVLTVLFVAIGGFIGGEQGAIIAFLFAAGTNFFAYWFSAKMVLKKYQAQEVNSPDDRLYRAVASLIPEYGLPMPKVYIIPQNSPNAFATGRNPKNAAVAATQGILNILDDDEICGVMAHELAHVRNRDMLTGTIAATLAGAITMISQFSVMGSRGSARSNPLIMILIMIIAPMAAMIVKMAISRSREFLADKGGAEISGKPLALASALRKLHNGSSQIPLKNGNPAHSHMFIVNPLLGGLGRMFASHPPVNERIQKLQKIAANKLIN